MRSLLPLIFIFCIVFKAAIASNDSLKREYQTVSYSGGQFTPFGAIVGFTYNKGHGFYFSARVNHHVFKTAQYYFEGSALNDRGLNWQYDGIKMYSRAEVNAGAIFMVFKRPERWSIKLYAGAGVLQPRYLYSYKKTLGRTSDHVWVEFKEISKMSINTEAGAFIFLNDRYCLNIGLSGITRKKERMVTLGFGVGNL
jgi:hypothetical protein